MQESHWEVKSISFIHFFQEMQETFSHQDERYNNHWQSESKNIIDFACKSNRKDSRSTFSNLKKSLEKESRGNGIPIKVARKLQTRANYKFLFSDSIWSNERKEVLVVENFSRTTKIDLETSATLNELLRIKIKKQNKQQSVSNLVNS